MNRRCGSCTACCKLVWVKELGKPAGTRCKYQKTSKGCAIYPVRPLSCKLWSCMWLTDPSTKNLKRPDRAGYVIDPITDRMITSDKEGIKPETVWTAIQVYVDPAHPDAHKDPALRAWLDETCKAGKADAVLVRTAHDTAFVLWPPSTTGGDWHQTEPHTNMSFDDFEDRLKELSG